MLEIGICDPVIHHNEFGVIRGAADADGAASGGAPEGVADTAGVAQETGAISVATAGSTAI